MSPHDSVYNDICEEIMNKHMRNDVLHGATTCRENLKSNYILMIYIMGYDAVWTRSTKSSYSTLKTKTVFFSPKRCYEQSCECPRLRDFQFPFRSHTTSVMTCIRPTY